MQFEWLANELFLEVFKFLTTSHLYHAFHDLILEYFRTCDMDFRSISKFDFDIILQQYLTPMTDRITSLCLSDEDDTPGQIDQFSSHGFLIRQFINLRSLFINNIQSEKIMDKIMVDLLHSSDSSYFHTILFSITNSLSESHLVRKFYLEFT